MLGRPGPVGRARREGRRVGAVRRDRAELVHGLARVLHEVRVGQRARRRRGADDPVLVGQQPGARQVVEPRQELALGEVPGRAEQHDDVVVRPRVRTHSGRARRRGHFFFSACPPNSERSADRIFPVNAPLSRDSNRWYSEAEITGDGTPSSTEASTVQRPSPESDTWPLKPSRSGDLANAAAARSTSQDETTEPRRHTSATSPTLISYW